MSPLQNISGRGRILSSMTRRILSASVVINLSSTLANFPGTLPGIRTVHSSNPAASRMTTVLMRGAQCHLVGHARSLPCRGSHCIRFRLSFMFEREHDVCPPLARATLPHLSLLRPEGGFVPLWRERLALKAPTQSSPSRGLRWRTRSCCSTPERR